MRVHDSVRAVNLLDIDGASVAWEPVDVDHDRAGQWRDRLDQRFIAGLPDEDVAPAWEIPAKLLI